MVDSQECRREGAPSDETPRGLFVGLTTLDIVYRVDRLPFPDEKMAPLEQLVVAGGPAANAAVAFAQLGGSATLVTALGDHQISALAGNELEALGVEIVDVATGQHFHPPLVTVMVQAESGERSALTVGNRTQPNLDRLSLSGCAAVDVVVVDGHLAGPAAAAARWARSNEIPVVLDAGSWKDGMGELCRFVDYAVCSEVFRIPGTESSEEVLAELERSGVPFRAVSRGPRPILADIDSRILEIVVPRVRAVDTLGAGDFLHGAFAFEVARGITDFAAALEFAAEVATTSCESFGPRAWLAGIDRFRRDSRCQGARDQRTRPSSRSAER